MFHLFTTVTKHVGLLSQIMGFPSFISREMFLFWCFHFSRNVRLRLFGLCAVTVKARAFIYNRLKPRSRLEELFFIAADFILTSVGTLIGKPCSNTAFYLSIFHLLSLISKRAGSLT